MTDEHIEGKTDEEKPSLLKRFWQGWVKPLVIIIFVVSTFRSAVASIVLDSPVGRALAGRMERRGLSPGGEDVTSERLSYLEGEVERLTTEMRKLEEESQFLNSLLTDRPDSQVLPPGDQSD